MGKTRVKMTERDVIINDIPIHIKSVFQSKIPLEKAWENIVIKKLSGLNETSNKF